MFTLNRQVVSQITEIEKKTFQQLRESMGSKMLRKSTQKERNWRFEERIGGYPLYYTSFKRKTFKFRLLELLNSSRAAKFATLSLLVGALCGTLFALIGFSLHLFHLVQDRFWMTLLAGLVCGGVFGAILGSFYGAFNSNKKLKKGEILSHMVNDKWQNGGTRSSLVGRVTLLTSNSVNAPV